MNSEPCHDCGTENCNMGGRPDCSSRRIADQAREIARLVAKLGEVKDAMNRPGMGRADEVRHILASEREVVAVVDVSIPRYALNEVANEKYFMENLIVGRTVQNGVLNGTVVVVGEKP